LDWADALLKSNSNRRAIVTTHYIIEEDDGSSPNAFSTQGQQIYDNLKDNPNLFLMLCGHRHGEGRRSDVFNENTITTLLADYQDYPNGGNGFLRIMEFRPSENKIYVSTYSPSLDQFETDSNSAFVLDYDMGSTAFQEIGNLSNVTSGSNASLDLSSLSPETEYEWYVQVSDGFNTITGPTWSFTTGEEDDPLPIFLTSFTATWIERGINLEWMVESEIDNAGFIIEKASGSEGGPFAEIASYKYMDHLQGRGSASSRKTYGFVDREVLSGQKYLYRLADISIYGTVTYHDVISINTEGLILNFKLQQNYPNPFNPVTTIAYSIPDEDHIVLKIYDVIGREIVTLVNDNQQAGTHFINFNAINLSSGLYFYKLQAGNNFMEIKKMLLLQ
jgi:hypothetical protein